MWDTNATGDGTGTGYTETDMIQLFRSLFTRTSNMGGVVPDYLNELAVTGTATPVAINTGAGLCYGIPYWNTASVTVAIATPAVSTRVDRIVLRADWTAQTVRITRIAGTEGAGTPAMTQSAGTTWDVPLATVSITTGGVITVTDAREWLIGVGDGTIDATKLADGAALAEILDDDGTGSGLDADLLDGSHAAAFAASAHTHDPRTGLAGTNGVIADSANGDARGTDAVDLQTDRAANGQVASGTNATVGGGKNNTASGNYSTVPGGSGAVANKYGQQAHASGYISSAGDAQLSTYTLRATHVDSGSAFELFLDGSSARLTIPSGKCMTFKALIIVSQVGSGEAGGYEFSGVIGNNGGTTALIGSVTKTVLGENVSTFDASVSADNTNDALVIFATPESFSLTYAVATVWTVETTY